MANLQTLNLPVNQLTGRIPTSLGRLVNLQQLSLGNNQLSGPIPTSIGNLGNLQYFVLTGNQLTGPIPASVGNLENLNYLRLDWNQLTGLVPLKVAFRGGRIQGSLGQCSLFGNSGLLIPDQPKNRAADLDADGEICHLPFTAIATANPQ
ncbi:MAG: leucine-rich repeat domain-containing protein [Gemmatimonadales bacterium]